MRSPGEDHGEAPAVATMTGAVEEGLAEAAGEGKPPDQVVWEYWIEEGEPLLDRLNELGAEGWELVGVAGGKLVFKRRRAEPPDDEGSGVREPRRPRPSAGSAPVRKPLDDDNS